jgi:uncharacterized C2H2 Zn-finger protein
LLTWFTTSPRLVKYFEQFAISQSVVVFLVGKLCCSFLRKHIAKGKYDSYWPFYPICLVKLFLSLKNNLYFFRVSALLVMLQIPCNLCSQMFSSESQYHMHKKNHLLERHRCTECHQTFQYKRSLDVHIRKAHKVAEGIKIGCQYCCKSYTTQRVLGNHMRIHHADKMFKCEVCSKVMSTRKNFQRHQCPKMRNLRPKIVL